MSVWSIVAVVVGSWCLLSVLVGLVVGHAFAGKSLRAGEPAGTDAEIIPFRPAAQRLSAAG